MTDRDDTPQIFGGVPRANLMPPEMGAAKREAAARRVMRAVILVVAIIVVAATAGAFYLSASAQASYSQAQQESQSLVTQKSGYADIIAIQSNIALSQAAVKVGGSTDIQWGEYLEKLQQSLPKGVVLQSVKIDSETAETPYPQSVVPLEGPRIGTITFSAQSDTIPDIPSWISGLENLPGYQDASPGSISVADDGYVAAVVMHINEDAFSHRFAPKEDGQ